MGTVLIIDDEKALRDVLRRVVESLGHHVIEAADGDGGLELFNRFSPALVITDVIMPERSGIEVVARLRAAAPMLPIVAMSGGGRAKILDLLSVAEKAGATVIIKKPFRRQELVAAIDGLISRPPHKAIGQ